MTWLTPKTNWTSDDYINAMDFNRIRNNLEYLKMETQKYFGEYDSVQVLPDEVTKSSYAYVEYWNGLENTLQDIVDHTIDMDIGSGKTFYPLQSYIDFNELNRLETGCMIYYNMLKGVEHIARRLSFTLGDSEGVKI